MNLDELRTVQSTERQKDSLQDLRPSFYEEVGEYVASLEAERDRIAAESADPFASPEVGRLTDEIETVKDVVQAIYERRMGKLVKQASLAAAGMSSDETGLTAEEAMLFDDLVERIETNQERVLAVLEGGGSGVNLESSTGDSDPHSSPSSSSAVDVDQTKAQETSLGTEQSSETTDQVADSPSVADSPVVDGSTGSTDNSTKITQSEAENSSRTVSQSGDELDTDSQESIDSASSSMDTDSSTEQTPGRSESSRSSGEDAVDRVTVRITRDVGSIFGVDEREYTLSSDDVVRLPEQNATPLVERDAAEPLE